MSFGNTIAGRAAQAVRDRAQMEGTSIAEQYDNLVIARQVQYHWESGRNQPSAYALQQMALAGYDVIYILIGDKRNEN